MTENKTFYKSSLLKSLNIAAFNKRITKLRLTSERCMMVGGGGCEGAGLSSTCDSRDCSGPTD